MDWSYVFWFRPEILSTRSLGGSGCSGQALSHAIARRYVKTFREKLPPSSNFFCHLEETVRGKSAPWSSLDIEAALELRNAMTAADISRQFIKEKEARQEAENAMQSREELMAVLSHDLKNPLSSIQLSAKLAEKFLANEGNYKERVAESLRRIMHATTNMNHLINDVPIGGANGIGAPARRN